MNEQVPQTDTTTTPATLPERAARNAPEMGRINGGGTESPDTIQNALGECQREYHVRVKCFPRWISEGKLSQMEARDRLTRMRAAIHFLQRLADLQPQEDLTGDNAGY